MLIHECILRQFGTDEPSRATHRSLQSGQAAVEILLQAIQRQIQFKHVHAGLTQDEELAPLRVLVD